ncbi:MAG: PEP/pyruvate-binding domain-containing protein [Thermoleophilia bacterium]
MTPTAQNPLTLALGDAAGAPVALVGGKARSLGRLLDRGLPAPNGLVITTAAYRTFVRSHGLAERIAVELARKPESDYRWEELWDAALRIRAWFLGNPWPTGLREDLVAALAELPGDGPVVVRSSSPHEVAKERSFAGMHESVVGVAGTDRILDAVRTVWASLFSDRSLLYRGELGLDPARSAMAVVVQPLAESDRSGVVFTLDPVEGGSGALEAVWGLGEGLVSGQVAPDRWRIDRRSGHIISHHSPEERVERLALLASGPALVPVTPAEAAAPPLRSDEVGAVWSLAVRAEELFGAAQDCEWTYHRGAPLLTQARPITTLPDDTRRTYLDLRPSYERLARLRTRIEDDLLPAMSAEAEVLAQVDLAVLTPTSLAAESVRRAEAVTRWRGVYREEFIPFAHGARLFGRFYNDAVRPTDPFEFVALLARDAAELATHTALLAELDIDIAGGPETVTRRGELENRFLDTFDGDDHRRQAQEMLGLGRASWRLRDDDNLYLQRVEREAERARGEVAGRLDGGTHDPSLEEAAAVLAGLDADGVDSSRSDPSTKLPAGVRPRQLLGQPAGPGLATGPARVIASRADLLTLQPGDIVVADALEPDTAAFAARAAGIVERRGGMLVHGAIVAREHGLPCVTGVPGATTLIRPGERLTVDGYLGIVVLDEV